jgi:protein TonB
MDRVRVICPSISFAAHIAGATILAAGVLVLPERLPAPARSGFDGLAVSRALAISLGGGNRLHGSHPGAPPRVPPDPVRVVAPTLVADLPAMPTIDLAQGPGVPGLPDDVGDGTPGFGFCLVNCGNGSGYGGGGGAILPELEPRPREAQLRVGGDVREPRKVTHVAPVYPALAVAAHVQGTVVLDCVIDADGRVSSVTVLKSQPLLEAAAVDAVRSWRYQPTLLNGTRVSVLLTVTVEFRLR